MKKIMLLIYILELLCLPAIAHATESAPFGIAYVEGGAYPAYTTSLLSLVRELQARKIIDNGNVPDNLHSNARDIWNWLSEHAGGTKVRFLPDAFYSSEWSASKRAENKQALLERIQNHKDVSIILAFGTSASQDFATDEHSVPTLCIGVTDPVHLGVALSSSDSGRDHVYVQIEPNHEIRQLTLFHRIFGFRKLGVSYIDTHEGRAFAGLARIETAAEQLGFELVRCRLPERVSPEADFEQLVRCSRTFANTADAVYMTYNAARQNDRIHQLLQPLISKSIPTFSQLGQEEVQLGALMSLSQHSHKYAGSAAARAIDKILQGFLPREVSQVLNPPLGLAINIRMAMLIGWEPSLETLAAVDEVFEGVGDMK